MRWFVASVASGAILLHNHVLVLWPRHLPLDRRQWSLKATNAGITRGRLPHPTRTLLSCLVLSVLGRSKLSSAGGGYTFWLI